VTPERPAPSTLVLRVSDSYWLFGDQVRVTEVSQCHDCKALVPVDDLLAHQVAAHPEPHD